MLGRSTTLRGLSRSGCLLLLLGCVGCSGSSRSGDDDDESGGAGGSLGSGGSGTGGGGGTSTNVYVAELRAGSVSKVDLLFMIDNSLMMSEKQRLLADSIPALIQRLTAPACVDELGNATGAADVDGRCPVGVPEFAPVQNLHVGIITSSLGDHGSADICSEAQNQQLVAAGLTPAFYNDLGQLLPSVRPTASLVSWNSSGFLVWDPRAGAADLHANLTEHETNVATFVADVTSHVVGPGETGCGYEGSLEAWYRFLVDPEPVTTMTNDGALSVRGTTNQALLAQRSAFLRPDSLLVIVMLTDENDCSVIDEAGTQGWLAGYKGGVNAVSWFMPRATSECVDPNDPCCRPCTAAQRAGCPDNAADPACSPEPTHTITTDAPNLRCWAQKQRFGVDLLYPTQRYVDAITSPFISPRPGGAQVPNPLFAGGRDPSLVVLGGIVGVPWQDLATAESLEDPRRLDYLGASELEDEGRWDILLGDPSAGVAPLDTLMVESVEPRTGGDLPQVHPLVPGAVLGPATGTTLTNPINGHELEPTVSRDQLQYACIFPLAEPMTCSDDNAASCVCNAEDHAYNSPLCAGVSADTNGVQTHTKATPSLRQLEVLKGVGEAAVVGSICPKNPTPEVATPAADPNYGYQPFVRSLLERLAPSLAPRCLPRPLGPSPTNPEQVPCGIVEVTPAAGGSCDCAASGRRVLVPGVAEAVREAMTESGRCGQTGAPGCDDFCLCGIEQLDGAKLASCQAGAPELTPGFCYIDPAHGFGSDEAVATCPVDQKRLLRFTGDNVPANGAMTFVVCDL